MTNDAPLAITADTFAAMMIQSLHDNIMHDPAAFLTTLRDFDDDADHLAELMIIDEFDCPDDLYALFDIDDADDSRMTALFALKSDDRPYALLTAAIRRYATIAPTLIATTP